jgi:hypothetical protein
MIVHFTTSKQDIKLEYENISKLANTIRGFGHTFAREWWEDEYKRALAGNTGAELDWKKINEENMGALARADVVIIEATGKTFSVGFQLANAIQQKKPTLVLTKNNSLSGTFGSGISSDFVRFENYDNGDGATKVIGDFLRDNTIDTKDMRFNFFINRPIYNYLRWASFKTGKTKAEILRQLVEREIENREP